MLISRKIRLEFYYRSNDCTRLKTFQNIHHEERCFIIGNGPSLNVEDLDLLKNEVTFAAHRIYNIFSGTEWRPTYYLGQDFVLLKEIEEQAKKVEAKNKFFPINIKWLHDFNIDDAVYFYLNSEEFSTQLPRFSKNASKEVYEGYSVTYAAIQLAVYMGFKEIYLLGVDFNYAQTIDNEGNIIIQEGVKDYFSNDHNIGLKLPNLEKSFLGFLSAKNFAEDEGVLIRNATRGGKLEVFKRIQLEEVLNIEYREIWNKKQRSYQI
ncbi:6-hydroxymethylpterin diphosphokinase MptE-like protein [Robertmurraya kyonggiensis]|uniref:6-hydroxymethylpterin diphosphokinase MptE-like protein n=1 Tax=Robertmurraya kyonggiensis TaxID=1037680 RepID=UPI001FE300F7|nr:6-hydroxymethylpterin diphosphokinase MptE-like protein [Robertmurraya kyonggiensis]